MSSVNKTTAFLFFSVFSLSALAEDAQEINFAQLPAAVQNSILNVVAKKDITKVELIHDEDATKYEIESKSSGVAKDVTVASNGSIMEIEQGSSLSLLSPSALQAIKHDYPNLVIDEIESVQTFSTSVEGSMNGKKVAFKVLATGNIEDDEHIKEDSKD